MQHEPLDVIPIWGVFALLCLMSFVTLEFGDRFGRWRLARSGEEKEGPIGAMVGAVMALLAFMLGFTFSLAATRFDSRRQIVLDEANAIGTTFRRARMLPQPERNDVAKLLKEYLNIRIEARQSNATSQSIDAAIKRSEEIQDALWDHAVSAAEKSPTDITGLFIESLSQTIELHAARIMVGIRGRVPLVIWLALIGLAMVGIGSIGYQSGNAALKRSPAMLALVVAFAITISLIVDLDRPGEGMLQTSQAALLDLQRRISTEPVLK